MVRWTLPKSNDVRIRERFLWFPKKIYQDVRWLERARWEERYNAHYLWREWECEKWLPLRAPTVDSPSDQGEHPQPHDPPQGLEPGEEG